MKVLKKPRDIKVVKRKKGEKVKIYYCDGFPKKFIKNRVYIVNCREEVIGI